MPIPIYQDIRKRFLAVIVLAASVWIGQTAYAADVYGPPNLLKTMPTPFGRPTTDNAKDEPEDTSFTAPIGVTHGNDSISRRLTRRIGQPRLYMPGTMVLGEVAEFTIHGPAGKWVALAMADKNTGSKPSCGHTLRLGADRKLVAITKIPEGGVGTLLTETPIEGDLVGSSLYFEAALWSKPDFSDVEFAQCIPSNAADGKTDTNGVLIAGQPGKKRGIRFIPDNRPISVKNSGLLSPRPGE
jgi:hypothetical protein